MDGLAGTPEVVLVGSANAVSSIDAAVLDRFDTTVTFGLPAAAQRRAALSYYAKHLPADEVAVLADRMEGWSFRRLARFAESVVRTYVSGLDLTRLEAPDPPLPAMEDYVRELAAN
jgi:AAA+ superfamily predicted ATPase